MSPNIHPVSGKTPRGLNPDYERKQLVWALGRLDIGGPWCPTNLTEDGVVELVHRLSSFETMTWAEVKGPDNHSVEISQIIPEAQRWLEEIEMDDIAQLFSLRVVGRQRIWGIRDGACLKLLWWDPEHEIYPSKKKHT